MALPSVPIAHAVYFMRVYGTMCLFDACDTLPVFVAVHVFGVPSLLHSNLS